MSSCFNINLNSIFKEAYSDMNGFKVLIGQRANIVVDGKRRFMFFGYMDTVFLFNRYIINGLYEVDAYDLHKFCTNRNFVIPCEHIVRR